MVKSKSLRAAYGEALVELGAKNDKVVAMDVDLTHATMTNTFVAKYPGRSFSFDTTEVNMVHGAAGSMHSGFLPFASTFTLFGVGRAYEQVRNFVSYVNTNVKFGLSRSSLYIGEDGNSCQSIEDIALMRVLLDITIFVPCDIVEMKEAVFAATGTDGPVYIHVARPVCDVLTEGSDPFIPGKANILRGGGDMCVIAVGLMIPEALKAAELLEKDGMSAMIVNMHIIKLIDNEIILTVAGKCGTIAATEEHSIVGGLGSVVVEIPAGRLTAKFVCIGIQDKFGQSGKPADLFRAYGLTAENIVETCRTTLRQNTGEDRGMGRLFLPSVRRQSNRPRGGD